MNGTRSIGYKVQRASSLEAHLSRDLLTHSSSRTTYDIKSFIVRPCHPVVEESVRLSRRQIMFASSSLHKNPSSWSRRINPIVVIENHLTTGWSSHNHKEDFLTKMQLKLLDMATAWLPTHFPFWSQVSYQTSSKPWGDGLRIPFTDTGVRLTNLLSTTFGTYQPSLAPDTNDVSKTTRSD